MNCSWLFSSLATSDYLWSQTLVKLAESLLAAGSQRRLWKSTKMPCPLKPSAMTKTLYGEELIHSCGGHRVLASAPRGHGTHVAPGSWWISVEWTNEPMNGD